MSETGASDAIARLRAQYEDYPYPPREPADERRRLLPTVLDSLPLVNHYCFGGRRDFSNGFRALVAGGGTGDSTIYLAEQLRDTDATIVHLDLSEASIDIARRRARIRGLEDSIEWRRGSLLELADVTETRFDYINSSGVLHHLQDPDAALTALRAVLADDGAMGLMVYAPYGRTAFYHMQALMGLVNHDVDDAGRMVANTRALIAELPATNWLKRPAGEIEPPCDLETDAGLVDLFLHSCDRAFTVPELYEWVTGASLHLIDFAPDYRPLYETRFAFRSPEIASQVAKLERADQQAACELYWASLGKHAFWAGPQPDPVAPVDDPEMVPFFCGPAAVDATELRDRLFDAPEGATVSLSLTRPDSPKVTCSIVLGPVGRAFLHLIDGRRTLGEILATLVGRREEPAMVIWGECLEMLDQLRPYDIVVLRHESVPERFGR